MPRGQHHHVNLTILLRPRRGGGATSVTVSLSPRKHALFAAASRRTLITCASRSPEALASRSAMSLRYRSAGPIIATYTGPVMKFDGGRNSADERCLQTLEPNSPGPSVKKIQQPRPHSARPCQDRPTLARTPPSRAALPFRTNWARLSAEGCQDGWPFRSLPELQRDTTCDRQQIRQLIALVPCFVISPGTEARHRSAIASRTPRSDAPRCKRLGPARSPVDHPL